MAVSSAPEARIYGLADARAVLAAEQQVRAAVLDAIGEPPSDSQVVTLSPSSAWVGYSVAGEVWDRTSAPNLPEATDAQRIAESFLRQLAQALSPANSRWPEPLAGVSLLPPVNLLRPAGLHAIARTDGRGWDHWLYRAEPRLPLDDGQTAIGVAGSQIEVRVGDRGRIVWLSCRWRPISGERLMVALSPYRGSAEDSHSVDSSEPSPPPPIGYVLDGENVPQHYLAPYYLSVDPHGMSTASASPYSLTVDIGRMAQRADRMVLTAVALGGSGSYDYQWATRRVDDVDGRITERGSGASLQVDTTDGRVVASSIEVENDFLIAMLLVRDRATGAFKHHQQQVFPSAFKGEAAGDTPAVS